MSNLRIGKFKDGSVVKPSANNPEWGSVMVVGETVSFNNGIMNTSRRIAFLRGKLEALQALGLQEGTDLNAKLASIGADTVKIVRKESLTPFYEGQEAKKNPRTEEFIKDASGNPIYMQDVLVNTSALEGDELIATSAPAVHAEAGDDA